MKKLEQHTEELEEIRKDLLNQIRDFFLKNPKIQISKKNFDDFGYNLFTQEDVIGINKDGVVTNYTSTVLEFSEMEVMDLDYTIGIINDFIDSKK